MWLTAEDVTHAGFATGERPDRVIDADPGRRWWHRSGMTVIDVVLGDITAEDVDAIVTAANESLLGGGGVDGAIHRAAGPALARAGATIAPCLPGDAKATPAFALDPPIRHVIHTVGPVWEGGHAKPTSWPSATAAASRSPTTWASPASPSQPSPPASTDTPHPRRHASP
jgi:hypothetical protein